MNFTRYFLQSIQGPSQIQTVHERQTNKVGIKVFDLADSPTGYVKRLQVYIGKGLDSCVTYVLK